MHGGLEGRRPIIAIIVRKKGQLARAGVEKVRKVFEQKKAMVTVELQRFYSVARFSYPDVSQIF